MAKTALDRFKVMLEEHIDGTITRREFAMRDFVKMMNEEPGTMGCHTINKDVVVSSKETKVATLPKGAMVKSITVKELKSPPENAKVEIGIKDGESFGTVEKKDKKAGRLQKRMDNDKELEEEKDVFLKMDGMKEGVKPEGHYQVVLHYEKFNELQ
jgi:flagellar hook assembly protein FlgD